MSNYKLNNDIPKVIKNLQEAESMALEMSAIEVHRLATSYAPVDTGRLSASISYELYNHYALVGTNVLYAKYQEYGTVNMKGTPFLRPAYDNSITKIKKIFEVMFSKVGNV